MKQARRDALKKVLRAVAWAAVLLPALLITLMRWPDARSAGDEDLLVTAISAVPPKENAAGELPKLKRSLRLSEKERSQLADCVEDAACKLEGLAPVFARNAEALRRFDALRGKRLQPPEWTDPAKINYETPTLEYAPLTQASNLSIAQARWLARQGRRAEALERLVRTAEVGQSLQTEPLSMLPFIVGQSLRLRALKAASDVLAARPALPSSVYKSAVARLGDPDAGRAGLERALRMEYTIAANMLSGLGSKEMGSTGPIDKLLRPRLFKPNCTRRMAAADYRELLQRAGQPCSNAERPQPPQRLWTHPQVWRGNMIGVILHQVGAPKWDTALNRRCEESFWTAAVGLSMGARAFASDNGRAPRSLSELVPRYAARVPMDPFAEKPLELSPDGTIASLGRDGKDKPLALALKPSSR